MDIIILIKMVCKLNIRFMKMYVLYCYNEVKDIIILVILELV